MSKSNEPILWAPFFAGAGISALCMPVMILLTSVAVSMQWLTAYQLHWLLFQWYVRLFLFVLISLSLFHAVHRIRFILVDMGLKAIKGVVSFLCYGSAVAGTVLAAYLLAKVHM